MQDFKNFIVRLQTFVIATDVRGANEQSSLIKLREFALTDVLSLPREQVMQQIKQLEAIHQIFLDFRTNYKTIPDYLRQEHQLDFFYTLELNTYFKVIQPNQVKHTDVNEQFLFDLLNLIGSREVILRDFIWSIENTIPKSSVSEADIKIEQLPRQSLLKNPTFKTEIISELFALLKDFFMPKDQSELFTLLQNTEITFDRPLVFCGNGNQLADGFKQLFDANLIIGCNKTELNQWILQHFSYKDKENQKNYSEKYLSDIISSDTKVCQSPILDVKKRESGHYGIFPTQRIKRNYKK